MAKENILDIKAYRFASRIIKPKEYLFRNKKEFIISKQVARSGTSIGANIRESIHAQSKLDFIHKLSIAQKEASETNYWIKLVGDGEDITEPQTESMLKDCEELQRMLTASIKTAKANLKAESGKV